LLSPSSSHNTEQDRFLWLDSRVECVQIKRRHVLDL